MNLMRVVKVVTWVLVLIMILNTDGDSAEGRRRNRKNRNRKKESGKPINSHSQQKRRHHQRRSHLLKRDDVSLRIQKQFFNEWQRGRSKPVHPRVKKHPQIEVLEWREALIFAQTQNETILHRATARLGHHSTAQDVTGKLVHISDPNMLTHFGCADAIGNKNDIPRDQSWIALIERGSCLFFNKIRLAKLHNASAVVIYNHQDKSEVMNTAGTNITAMMISSSDGRKLVMLIEANKELEMKIRIHKEKRSKSHKKPSTPAASSEVHKSVEKKNTDLLDNNIDSDSEMSWINLSHSKHAQVITQTLISPTSASPSLRICLLNVFFCIVLTCAVLTSSVR